MTKELPSAELRQAHDYLLSQLYEEQNKSRRIATRDELKPWIIDSFDPDENGNHTFEFPEPVTVDGVHYFMGLMARRRVSEYTNEQKARDLIANLGLDRRCIKTVTTYELDLDEVYACNQEGLITDEEIDSLIETDITFSLEKLKAA